jgi:hypothetical protein
MLFVVVMHCFFCEVGTNFFYVIQMNFMFQKVTNTYTIHKELSHSGVVARVPLFEGIPRVSRERRKQWQHGDIWGTKTGDCDDYFFWNVTPCSQ